MDQVTIDGFPRVPLAHLPTPLEPLAGLSRRLGTKILTKRDDCTGLATGGNKARKLEYLLAEARAEGADTIVTAGALQSNHARQTAAGCARLGMACELVLTAIDPTPGARYCDSGNLLIDELCGAAFHFLPAGQDSTPSIDRLTARLRREGRHPYTIPVGGSNALGSLGYVRCAFELAGQISALELERPVLIHPTGSGGTQAGLLAGFSICGAAIPIIGVSVGRSRGQQEALVSGLVEELGRLLGGSFPAIGTITVYDDYAGPAYGQPTPACVEAVRTAALADGLLLDPVYSGKAMAGLIDLLARGAFQDNDAVIFLHTGGSASLFAYAEVLASRICEPGMMADTIEGECNA